MFEFHGWVTVNEGACEAEDSEEARNIAVGKLHELIAARTDGWSLAELRQFNGQDFLLLHGFRNHYQPWVAELFEITGVLAPGSYGALYVRDDEDPSYANEMQVLIMRRGKVVRHKDELFSPCIPVLER